jgi:hypothetical protein
MSTDLIVTKGTGLEVWEKTETVFANLQDGLDPEQRKKAVRDTMVAAINIDDRLNLVSGELLYEVANNKYWQDWEFESFADYCESELNMRERKAKYLISIYNKFVIELNLPTDILLELQWSKAKELISVITEDNWPDLIDGLNDLTMREVKEKVRGIKLGIADESGDDDSPPESDPITTRMSFNLSEEQANNIRIALDLAASMSGSDKTGNQLDLICSDFLASSVGKGLDAAIDKLDFHIGTLSRVYGVKLVVESVDTDRYSDLTEESADV